jgi:outer membrane protein TolC
VQNNVTVKRIEQAKANKEVNLDMSRSSWLPSVSANIGQNLDVGRSPSKDGTIKDQSSNNSSFYLHPTWQKHPSKRQGVGLLVEVDKFAFR